ncbi:flagellin [uncultured Selenomonas sp.]|uniref:flagellin N-terminal helical domain-containing protein n=1 Tax=uncultured Selenomonas sp. TaxID=159275 RepID=UPI0025E6CCB6|nr:flagellin [uncultured Selenomonas sp.]
MAMTVMNNGTTMSALGEANKNNSKLSKDLKKVASGMRVGGAGDDAATYSISEKMRVMVRSLGQDIDNAKKGIDLVNVAENGIDHIVDQLRSLKAMAIDSANDHNTDADRATLQKEFDKRIEEINDTAAETNYNGKILLDGRYWYREYDEDGNPISPLATDVMNAPAAAVASMTSSKSAQAMAGASNMMSASKSAKASLLSVLKKVAASGTTSTLKADSSAPYVENSISGLFPTPSGKTAGKASVSGYTGYMPPPYKTIYRYSDGTYNFYDRSTKHALADHPYVMTYDAYTTIPPVGTSVSEFSDPVSDDDKGVHIAQQLGTGNYIVEGSDWMLFNFRKPNEEAVFGSEVEMNFGNVTANGSAATFPDSFHGQGFTVVEQTAFQPSPMTYPIDIYTSVVFDATMDAGTGKLLTDTPQGMYTWTGDVSDWNKQGEREARQVMVVGIKGATDTDSLGDAIYSGIKLISDTWSMTQTAMTMNHNPLGGGALLNGTANFQLVKSGGKFIIRNVTTNVDANGMVGKLDLPMIVYNGVMGVTGAVPALPSSGTGSGTGGTGGTTGGTTGGNTGTGGTGGTTGGSTGTGGTGGTMGGTNPPTQPTQPTDVRKGRRFEGNPLIIHYGPRANQHLRIYINDMHAKAMGLEGVGVDPREKAIEALSKLDVAVDYALNESVRMGAYQQKLRMTIANNTTAQENVTSSESTIRDADMAKEMVAYTKDNVLAQAAQAMLAQANQSSAQVLQLLQ